jgi:phosphoribosylaminoimidazole-succinocarboxamide synthase
MSQALFESTITSLPLIAKGKVRDIYAVGDDKLLVVSSDRLSAFDVILPDPIPGKGKVLTQTASFWFKKLAHIVATHSTDIAPETVVAESERAQVRNRAVVVKRLRPLPIEAVVRGYIIGSGWKDYQDTGAVCGIKLPAGLKQADKLPQLIFTPATKAAVGDHDENISFEQAQAHCDKELNALLAGTGKTGSKLVTEARDAAFALYQAAADYAATKGIIIADTKFEFGIDDKGTLHLIDEILTPDSSRFWPADAWKPGSNPPSYDKQYVRDYLETLDWNKKAPGPTLPQSVIEQTAAKYHEAFEKLTGQKVVE